MLINKKTRAVAACLLMLLITPIFSGCALLFPSDFGSVSSDREEGLYINGQLFDMDVPSNGSYYYNQLTETEKTIYTAALNALTEGVSIFELVDVNCDEFSEGCELSVEALVRDHPEFFWIDGGFKISAYQIVGNATGNLTVTLTTHKYWDEKDIQAAVNEIAEVTDAIICQANEYSDPYEKVKFVNKWLAEHVEYDIESLNDQSPRDNAADAFVNTVYGTLVAGKTLCGGYAYTFSYILNSLGIETLYVTGTADGGRHAWNLVNLGGEYYHIDPTWSDDDEHGQIQYLYFGLTDEEIAYTHSPDSVFTYPTANGTEYNYYQREGLYLESYSFNNFSSLFSQHGIEDGFTVKFSSSVVLNAAVRDLIDNAKFYKLHQMGNVSTFSYSIDENLCILSLYR